MKIENQYLIFTGYDVISCADIDDMTEETNRLLHEGCTDLELVVKEDEE